MVTNPYHPRNKIVLLLILLLTFTIQSFTLAQSGSIKGTIYDQESNETLVGANIVLLKRNLGAASDLDGNYVIRNIPVGKQTIVISYIGYESDSVEVTIVADRALGEDFHLKPLVIEGETVTVTAQALGQVSAIQQQLTSNKIVNVVSEAKLQELPDFNAAQSLSRLPGVSVQQSAGEANKVVIRGLAPQFNAVAIEGIKMASTGSTQIGASSLGNTSGQIKNDRSVDLAMITPYMIKSIEVYKAITPDFNANVIGGFVNMQLREAPSGLHYDVLWQSGYTKKSGQYGNYRAVASVSTRFFDDKLGVYFLGNLEEYDRNADNMNASYSTTSSNPDDRVDGFLPVKVRNVTLNRHVENRRRGGLNLILDYKLPNGSIKAINMFTRLNSEYEDYGTQFKYGFAGAGDMVFNYRYGENQIDQSINTLDFSYDFDLFSINLKASYQTSKNSLPESPFVQFFQTGAISAGSVEENTIPQELNQYVNYRGDSSSYMGNMNLFSSTYKENNQNYIASFKFPFNESIFSGFIKFGGEYKHEEHSNDQETPYANMNKGNSTLSIQYQMIDDLEQRFGVNIDESYGRFQASEFASTDDDLYEPFLNGEFGDFPYATNGSILRQMMDYLQSNPDYAGRAGNDPGGWFNGLYQQLTNDYEYKEDYYAAYAMAEVNFWNIMVVGGVRYEKDKSDFFAYNARDARSPDTQIMYPVTVKPENEFVLPMIQFKYDVFDWLDIRYAFSQTLARPDYHQLSPKYTISNSGNSIWAGNPGLKPAQATNHDLIFSFHSNMLGLLSVGGFYKTIEEFTYSTSYTLNDASKAAGLDSLTRFNTPSPNMDADVTLYSYINSPFDATIKGFEFDFQHRLWYTPFPLNGIVLGINYTFIESETRYPFYDQESYLIPPTPENPRGSIGIRVIDSSRAGRMINQPNNIMNAFIGYDYLGFSARCSFVFQGNEVRSIGRYPESDGYTKDYFRMDVSVRQKLPVDGLELFLDLYNVNNENNRAAQRSIDGFTNIQNYGLTVNLGVRYRH